jgi:membrane associated rhomboid family serine protease
MAYAERSFQNPFGFRITPWVKRLLIANGLVYLITAAVPALRMALAFTPAQVLVEPWTPFTYMFVHGDLWHLLFNMLVLFFFGPPLEERWGSREFIKFYLIAGFGAALLSLFTPYVAIIGASGAVYGVMLAYALYWPDNPIYIWGILPVKAKWFVAFLAGLSVFLLFGGGQPGVAHLAHLGGFATAFLYLKSDWGPSPWGARARPAKKPPASDKPRRSRRTQAAVRKLEAVRSDVTDQSPADQEELLDDVDRILDKISSQGLSSLTEAERKRLEEVSRRYRSN